MSNKNPTSEETVQIANQLFPSVDDILKFNCDIVPQVASQLIDDKIFNLPQGSNSIQKGDALEEVVNYFLINSGMFYRSFTNEKSKQHELDHFSFFDRHLVDHLKGLGITKIFFLGESKNYEKKTLKVDIAYKVEGLKLLLKSEISCIFTRVGMTGCDELSAAKGVMRSFNEEFKNFSLVYTDADWNFLKANPLKFNKLFLEKIMKAIMKMSTDDIDYSQIQ